jgi:hypothetical protein
MAMSLRERIAAAGRSVAPQQVAEMIQYNNVPLAIVKYVASEWKNPGAGQTKKWLLHTFRCPDGLTFSLGGCMGLDTRLRSCKVGDVLTLEYNGKHELEGDRMEHRWEVTLMTASKDDLRAMVAECAEVYSAIREAVTMAAEKRKSGRASVDGDGAPPHSDDDYNW